MRRGIVGAVLALAFATGLGPASGEPIQHDIVRGWSGITSINDLPQPVELRVASLVPGTKQALELVFPPPRDCQLSAQYAEAHNGAYLFRVEKEACGAAFRPGAGVTLRMIEGVLKYELTRQDGSGFLEVGYLLPKK